MKLSEKLRQRRHDDITMLHHSNIGMELIRDAEQLEEENEGLRNYVGHTQICPARYEGTDMCVCGFDALLR